MPYPVEILTIGREILDGRVIDTNAAVLATELRALGLVARFGQRVDDDLDRICDAFRIAAERARIVLVTGGLGPTSDDLTAQAFARFLGEPLRLDEEALAQITDRFKRAGVKMLEVQKKQAYVPASCFILENGNGTAPGFGLARAAGDDGTEWYFMPGVPREMALMLRTQVIPKIRAHNPQLAPGRSETWATQFTSEGDLQERLTPVEKKLPPGYELTYRTRFPENHIALYAPAAPTGAADPFDSLCAEISRVLDRDVFSRARGDEKLPSLEEAVIQKLRATGSCLATVESCTGGQVAHRVTSISGSSEVFWGAHVTYDNSAKESLGVPKALLVEHGAVSAEVARALAEAGLARMLASPGLTARGTPLCVSTTGIAGPSGGTEAKPVGLCHIALARPGQPTIHEELHGRKVWERDYLKTYFSQKALELIRKSL